MTPARIAEAQRLRESGSRRNSEASPQGMIRINASHALGLRSFSCIHDSYGTHAGNAQALGMMLRGEFVRMYSEADVLADFTANLKATLPADAELPPLPPHGTLDLQAVLESNFFFA
jgi:Autographiviridae RNA polymerase